MDKIEKENSYSRILKYTGIFGGVQGLNILIGIARNKFSAILLGANGMGLVALFNSTINMIVSATNFGIPTSGVQVISSKYQSQSDQLSASIKSIRSWSLLTALLGSLICILFSPYLDKLTFTWGNHVLHFILLSPVVGLTILASGEMAVLKATRQLKSLASSSLLVIALSLVISVPIYYFWNQKGIIAVFVFQALAQCLATFRYSLRFYPYSVSLSPKFLKNGIHIIKLGTAFVIAGLLNAGAEFMIRTFINNVDGLDEVGFFNAGWTLAVVYAGLVFSAMDADYYPRLSSITDSITEQNDCVNKQIEMNVLLVTPILTLMLIGLPIGIPLLYDSEFSVILRMTQLALVSMLWKAIYIPIEYLPLSKGQSWVFLIQESGCVILLIACEIAGYHYLHLNGLGLGILVAYFLETIGVLVYSKSYYSFRLSRKVVMTFFPQAMFLAGTVVWIFMDVSAWCYWLIGIVYAAAHLSFTLHQLKKKTNVLDILTRKLRK